jgi:hypothetical protein
LFSSRDKKSERFMKKILRTEMEPGIYFTDSKENIQEQVGIPSLHVNIRRWLRLKKKVDVNNILMYRKLTREEALEKGLFEYKGMWINSETAREMSLVKYDDIWMTKDEMKKAIVNKEGTYAHGKIEGERAAKGNPLWVWVLVAPAVGVFGVAVACFGTPNAPIPAHALIGKSSDYVLSYTERYQNETRSINAGNACDGWAA